MASAWQLPRSAPEAQGIASSAILAFVEAVEQNIRDLHSLMLLRHGQVVAEGWWSPYGPERPHMLFSLSKSFTVDSDRPGGGRRGCCRSMIWCCPSSPTMPRRR